MQRAYSSEALSGHLVTKCIGSGAGGGGLLCQEGPVLEGMGTHGTAGYLRPASGQLCCEMSSWATGP